MAGYLVHRPSTDDKLKVSNDINGVFVNGSSGSDAIANAIAQVTRWCGPNHAAYVNNWTAVQVSSSDFDATLLNTVFQGEVVRPGQHLRGGGMIV